jgi:adhesin/invasin
MRARGAGLLVAALSLGAGCTALLGPPRQNGADQGAPDLADPNVADLSTPDLGGGGVADLSAADLATAAGADLAGVSAPNATNSTIQSIPGSVTADGSSNAIIRVTVLDGNSQPVVGEPVSLASTGTNHTLTPSSGITNGQGIFNATLASTRAEQKMVSATIAGFMLQTNVQFTAGSAQSGHSTLQVAPASIAAGGATAAITVTVLDGNDNPVVGQSVTLSATGTGNTITPGSGMTDAAGVLTATISSTKAEMKTVTAQVGSFMLNQPLTVVAGAPSAALSTVTASPVSGLPANGSAASTITVTVRDANSNLAGGVAVTLSANGSNNTFTPAGGSTNAVTGVLTSTLTTTTAETKTVTAVAGGVTITQKPTVVFDACPVATAIGTNGVPVGGTTVAGSNEYHPLCATPADSTEKVYGFSLAAASSVLIDRSSSFANAVTDLRTASMSCSADSNSYGCTPGQYLYCPNVAIGSYQVVVDGVSASAGTFNLAVTAPGTTKGANSYGVVTRAETTSSFVTILGAVGTTEIVSPPATGLVTDGFATTALPFAFRYFGTAYASGSTLTAFRSGYLAFGSSTTDTFQNVCLPATAQLPSDVILPFWARLTSRGGDISPPSGRGRILVRTQGAVGSRTHTIEWNQFDGLDNTSATECVVVSFQVILHEATQQIELRYDPGFRNTCGMNTTKDPTFPTGGLATIGLRSGTVTILTEPLSCNSAAPVVGTCDPGTGATINCDPNKSYMFVPKSASCP